MLHYHICICDLRSCSHLQGKLPLKTHRLTAVPSSTQSTCRRAALPNVSPSRQLPSLHLSRRASHEISGSQPEYGKYQYLQVSFRCAWHFVAVSRGCPGVLGAVGSHSKRGTNRALGDHLDQYDELAAACGTFSHPVIILNLSPHLDQVCCGLRS